MKNVFQKLLPLLALGVALIAPTSAAQEQIQVTASFSILGDLVRAVAGDRVVVTTLIGPDEDAHVFEPRPADARGILKSSLLVSNGLGFEPWMQRLVQSAGYKGEVLLASKGVKVRAMAGDNGHKGHDHGEADPHAWQNPTNTIIYVRNIAAALTRLDAAGASTYQRNSEAYIQELQALDTWARAQFASIAADKRKVITSHDAFGYFAAHYGLTFLAPQGVSTGVDSSAKDVARLIRQIKHDKIRAVFIENMSNPKLIEQVAKDTGVVPGLPLYVDALSASDEAGASYLKMMRHNVSTLVAGMRKN